MIDFQNMINGADLWIASSLMVMMSLIQAGLFLRTSWKEAGILGFSNKQKTACLRSAALTARGPLAVAHHYYDLHDCHCGRSNHLDGTQQRGSGAHGTGGGHHGGKLCGCGDWRGGYGGPGIHLCPVGHCAERVWLAVCRMGS